LLSLATPAVVFYRLYDLATISPRRAVIDEAIAAWKRALELEPRMARR